MLLHNIKKERFLYEGQIRGFMPQAGELYIMYNMHSNTGWKIVATSHCYLPSVFIDRFFTSCSARLRHTCGITVTGSATTITAEPPVVGDTGGTGLTGHVGYAHAAAIRRVTQLIQGSKWIARTTLKADRENINSYKVCKLH